MYEIYEKILKERGLKNADVSRGTGIAPSTLADWKHGRIKTLKMDKMKLIADFLGVSVDFLLTGREPIVREYEIHPIPLDTEMRKRLNFYFESISKYLKLKETDRVIVDEMIERLGDDESKDEHRD